MGCEEERGGRGDERVRVGRTVRGARIMSRRTGRSLSVRIAVPFVIASLVLGIGSMLLLTIFTSGRGPIDTPTFTAALGIWTLVSASLFAALGVTVARHITSRLRAVAEGARRVAEGDYSACIDLPDGTEIADLGESFNDMTLALRERSESLTKKVLDLSALHESSRILGSTLELDALLGGALDSALRVCGVDTGYVTMRDGDSGMLLIRARRGHVPDRVSEDEIEMSMAGWVMRESRPLIINPSRDDEGARVDSITGAVSAMCVPLVSAEGPIGTVTVGTLDQSFRFGSDDVRLLATIANHVTTAIGTVEAFNRLHDSYLATVRSLAAAVDAKDPYTRGHSDRVAHYATLAAGELELTHDQRMALEMAAYLHDIGKIGIPEDILLKPGRLSEEEMAKMRHHPLIGANILDPVSFPWPITPVVRHHHERWDGAGYPTGLAGAKIPLLARVLSVADAYEAMISDRPYRAGRSMQEGLAELEACAGSQFDPEVVVAFTSALGRASDADAAPDVPTRAGGLAAGPGGSIV
jgi:putative nucleotidyltransferase with HDIG domain